MMEQKRYSVINPFPSSILFPYPYQEPLATEPPDCFYDLNLDQLIDTITGSKPEYDLKPLFWSPLRNVKNIQYRQEVMQDLENPTLLKKIKEFVEKMGIVRRYRALAETLDYEYHRKGWILEAVFVYTEAIQSLYLGLETEPIKSEGLRSFRTWVQQYVESEAFQILHTHAHRIKKDLSSLRYCVLLNGDRVRVKRFESERDYSTEIEQLFEKFQQGAVESYLIKYPERAGINHVEGKILELVAKLFPEPFDDLDSFLSSHEEFFDPTMITFDREIQFYLAYLDFIFELKTRGYSFCYPTVQDTCKEESVQDGFDLMVAAALMKEGKLAVKNDFSLRASERILVVTGPNQGGKTTFARMVGQIHYLASLGFPVPGTEASLFLVDKILTHFERKEEVHTHRGKLEDDLYRIHTKILQASSKSLFILNEIFTSTTLQDAIFLSKQIMTRLLELDAICVWVTFLDELSSINEKTVSMVAQVDPVDPTIRTFHVVREPADGLSYALSLAHKYRLTYEQIRERLS
ncbi:MAG: DNA mismatch repair protein MutS [Spirochaetes bacterium]|nr:DNA mismatch repair protein MutS [Spirochaetota bacterium]